MAQSVVFGKRMLGEAGAAAAKATANNGSGGGALKFGPRLGGFKKGAIEAPPISTLAQKQKRPRAKETPSPLDPPKPLTAEPEGDEAEASVAELAAILKKDPNDWSKVLNLESGRKEIRPMVAALVLSASNDPALTDPIPEPIITMLMKAAK